MLVFAVCGPLGAPFNEFFVLLDKQVDKLSYEVKYLDEIDYLNENGALNIEAFREAIEKQTAKNIVIRGHYFYEYDEIKSLIFTTIFLETPDDICLLNFVNAKTSENYKFCQFEKYITFENAVNNGSEIKKLQNYLNDYEKKLKPINSRINLVKSQVNLVIPYNKIKSEVIDILLNSFTKNKKINLQSENNFFNTIGLEKKDDEDCSLNNLELSVTQVIGL